MKLIMGALLVSGLAIGCMDVEEPSSATDEPAVSEAEQDSIVWCNGKIWQVNFYSDAALTNYIGYIACNSCYGPETRSGSTSNYTRLVREYVCEQN